MAKVVGKDTATGSFAKSFVDIDSEEKNSSSHQIDFGVDFGDLSRGKQVGSSSEVSSETRSHRKRKRDQDDSYDKLSQQIGEVASAIKKLTEDKVNVNELYDEVIKIEGYNESMLGIAFDHLVANEKIGKAFMVKNDRL